MYHKLKRSWISIIQCTLTITLLVYLACFQLSCGRLYSGKQAPRAAQGVLDLSDWNFEIDGPVSLRGEWEFYWSQLLVAKDLEADRGRLTGIVNVPSDWNDYRIDGHKFSGMGFGTFRLRLILPKSGPALSLRAPEVGTSFRLFSDHTLLARAGRVSSRKSEAIGEVRPGYTDLPAGRERSLILQISNYHHFRGGFWNVVQLGTRNQIQNVRLWNAGLDIFLCGALFLMGLYHVALYAFRRKDLAAIWFGAFCLIITLRLFLTGERLALYVFPGALIEVVHKLEYLAFYTAPPVFALFVNSLFPAEFRKSLIRLILFIGSIFVLIVLLFPAHVFTLTILPYELFTLLCGLYLLWVGVAAIGNKRDNAGFFMLGCVILLAGTTNDILRNQLYLPTPYLAPMAIFFFSIVQLIMLSRRSAKGFLTMEKLSAELEARNAELDAKNIELTRLDRLKDEFLSNTSHELRTPLSGIIGIADSLVDGVAGPVNESMRFNLALIVSSGRRLSSLVNDILDFQKLKNRDIELAPASLNLHAMTEVVLAVSAPLVGARELELLNEVPVALVPVEADENRLQQILHNLVGNAIKFTREGKIIVSAREKDGFVEIRVSDSGIGIEHEKQSHIFESFEQGDSSTEREYGGSGLGLSITRRLVELHGGSIRVESTLGLGATFMFTLPIASGKPAPFDPTKPAAPLRTWAEPVEGISLYGNESLKNEDASFVSQRKALIVDDEIVNRQTLLNLLSLRNYQVLEAADGEKALELVESEKPDVVLLDVMMPRMSGYEVCRRLRESYKLSELPVIMLTAKNRAADLVAGFESGASDYLSKPFSKEELLTRVRNQVNLKAFHTESLRLRKRLIENEKMVTVGNMAAGIVHDLRNHLTVIKGYVQLADVDDINRTQRREYLEAVESEAESMALMAQDLLDFSRGLVSIHKREVDLEEYLDRVMKTLGPGFAAKDIEFFLENNYRGKVWLDPDRFLRALVNIAGNAQDAMLTGGRFEIIVFQRNGRIFLELKDTGPGIPPEIRENLFEPFVTKGKAQGTGLGMAITKNMVEAHGGTIRFETGPRGATFIIELPTDAPESV